MKNNLLLFQTSQPFKKDLLSKDVNDILLGVKAYIDDSSDSILLEIDTSKTSDRINAEDLSDAEVAQVSIGEDFAIGNKKLVILHNGQPFVNKNAGKAWQSDFQEEWKTFLKSNASSAKVATRHFLNYFPIYAAVVILLISVLNLFSVSAQNEESLKRADLENHSKAQAVATQELEAPVAEKSTAAEKSEAVTEPADAKTDGETKAPAVEAVIKKVSPKPIRARIPKSKLRALKTQLSEAVLVANYDPDQAREEMKVILKSVPAGHSFRSTVLSELRKIDE